MYFYQQFFLRKIREEMARIFKDPCNDLRLFFKDFLDSGEALTRENLRSVFLKSDCENLTSFSLVSSAHGKLEEILIVGENGSINYLADKLIEKKSVHTQIFAYTMDDVKPKNCLVTWWENKSSFSKSLWVQDHFITLFSPEHEKTLFLEPILTGDNLSENMQGRYSSKIINSEFGNGEKYLGGCIPFFIEGGNILIGDSFFFLGEIALKKTIETFKKIEGLEKKILVYRENYDDLRCKEVSCTYKDIINRVLDPNRELIVISQIPEMPKKTPDPENPKRGFDIFSFFKQDVEEDAKILRHRLDPKKFRNHLDMFMTLGGKNKFDQYLIFVGKPEKVEEETDTSQDDFFEQIETWFCDFKEKLERELPNSKYYNFKIIDIPMPVLIASDVWQIFSYNNAIVEIYEGTEEEKKLDFCTKEEKITIGSIKRIMMPVYELPKVDKILERYNILAAKRYCESEFQVVLFEGLNDRMKEYGSLHCLTKDLKRTNYGTITV